MLRSSYLWNSQAKVCPAPLSGSFRRPLPAAPLLPLLVSQCHLPTQDPGRCLVFASSATTQRLLQQSHSPFWASGCLRAELSLEQAGSPLESCLSPPTSPVCCLILAELSPRASVSLSGRLDCVRDQAWYTTLRVPTQASKHRCDQFSLSPSVWGQAKTGVCDCVHGCINTPHLFHRMMMAMLLSSV